MNHALAIPRRGAAAFALACMLFGSGTGAVDFDVDGNGSEDAGTDGQLILRYLFGFRGETLTAGAVAADAVRDEATIVAYLVPERKPNSTPNIKELYSDPLVEDQGCQLGVPLAA